MSDVVQGVQQAPETFSSWDKCMQKSYCKWPVIAVIIVGSLIALSLLFCLFRCLCCGAECVCCCFKCCKGCCGSGRRNKEYNQPPPNNYSMPFVQGGSNQQYQSHAAPAYAPAPVNNSPYINRNAGARAAGGGGGGFEAPQYARFESPSKPQNDDALPAMPSWSEAKSTRIEDPDARDEVEMDRLQPAVATPAGRSPVQSPHGEEYGFGGAANTQQRPYAGGYHTGPYRSNGSFRGEPQRSPGYAQGQQHTGSSYVYTNNDGYQETGVHSDNRQETGVNHDQYAGYAVSHNNHQGYHQDRQQDHHYGSDQYAHQPAPKYSAQREQPRQQNPYSDPYARQPSPNYSAQREQPRQHDPYSDPYAHKPSPNYNASHTPYPEEEHYGGHAAQPYQQVQQVQQSGYQTRTGAGGWREV